MSIHSWLANLHRSIDDFDPDTAGDIILDLAGLDIPDADLGWDLLTGLDPG